MADISKIKIPNNTEYNVKDAALTTEITNARGSYVNLDARLDNYDEVIGDIDTALNSLLVDLVPKTITENGTYDPADDNADGYSSVSVDVPNTYTQADEGKVVSNGVLVTQTAMSTEITENDTYDTTLYNSVTVNVPQGGGGLGIPTIGRLKPYLKKTPAYIAWSTKTWNGLTSFYGQDVWTDGENIYYSYEDTQCVLDKSTSTWSTKTWNGLTSFYGRGIWTDGENIYREFSHVLDKSTSSWLPKTWDTYKPSFSSNLWTDGENIYYSYTSTQYVLDKSTSTWSTKTWNGLTSFYGSSVWTDGENIYYCYNGFYVLDKSTSTWRSLSSSSSARREHLWTDGNNIYMSSGSNGQYIYNKFSKTFVTCNTNDSDIIGNNIWTDGDNIYYSSQNTQKVLVSTEGGTPISDELRAPYLLV